MSTSTVQQRNDSSVQVHTLFKTLTERSDWECLRDIIHNGADIRGSHSISVFLEKLPVMKNKYTSAAYCNLFQNVERLYLPPSKVVVPQTQPNNTCKNVTIKHAQHLVYYSNLINTSTDKFTDIIKQLSSNVSYNVKEVDEIIAKLAHPQPAPVLPNTICISDVESAYRNYNDLKNKVQILKSITEIFDKVLEVVDGRPELSH